MKRLKVIALAVIALVISPTAAQAFDIPLLTYRIVTGKQIGRAHV